jgi:pantoate--beta-alanine ligase
MHVFKTKKDLAYFLENERIDQKKIGFVPTMGALHEGHLELVRHALRENDVCVCSIFINPAQFNNPEDLKQYPVQIDEDLGKLEKEGCHVVFVPEVSEIYEDPSRLTTILHFGEIERILEGKYRPGHFQGVGLVIAKLFNIIKPYATYFGQKDLQQYHLIKQLIRDLSYDIKLKCVPTIREKDGLALSSRNMLIPPEYRSVANKFYECLLECRKKLVKGENTDWIKSFAGSFISRFPPLRLEYIELVETSTFRPIEKAGNKEQTALCISGYINNIRLIDNVLIN